MKTTMVLAMLLIYQCCQAQQAGLDMFVRVPHLVNVNFSSAKASYTSAVSAGITLRYAGFFADIGSFIDGDDYYGHYVYFGSTVLTKKASDSWSVAGNWFGETTLVPSQQEDPDLWIYTIGISPVLIHPIQRGSLAIAFTLGAAFHNRETSLNSRIVFNYSLPLFNR
jgi:hypothetical protein